MKKKKSSAETPTSIPSILDDMLQISHLDEATLVQEPRDLLNDLEDHADTHADIFTLSRPGSKENVCSAAGTDLVKAYNLCATVTDWSGGAEHDGGNFVKDCATTVHATPAKPPPCAGGLRRCSAVPFAMSKEDSEAAIRQEPYIVGRVLRDRI